MLGRQHEPTGAALVTFEAGRPFSDYLTATRQMIKKYRIDLTPETANKITEANSPFEWRPYESDHFERGILLVHGLYDSPYMMRDIGAHFLKQGYLVRSILIPGHGTTPGDLLNVSMQNWLDAVAYGIDQTSPMVDKLYLCGYSLGAALCQLNHKRKDNIKGMIFIAPGVKSTHRYANILRIHHLFTWISKKAKWYQIAKQDNYVKYNSHPYNPGRLTVLCMQAASKMITHLPIFVVATEEDETIEPSSILRFYKAQTNALNQMIYYCKEPHDNKNASIEERSSVYPERNIIDFSHICLPISPSNPYLGEYGELLDFSHYPSPEDTGKKLHIGAITPYNLLHFTMQRLSYNPDFDYMMHRINSFIENLGESTIP
ncbi:MAG: alpha/beta hydrolase [Pseudomonadota bacterium]|nr:alpha/beta hydrolase [Pseudomonadota bacterium]